MDKNTNLREHRDEPEWFSALLSFGVSNNQKTTSLKIKKEHTHRRYTVIRRRDGVESIQTDISAGAANKLRQKYRAEGYRVDLIEVGTQWKK